MADVHTKHVRAHVPTEHPAANHNPYNLDTDLLSFLTAHTGADAGAHRGTDEGAIADPIATSHEDTDSAAVASPDTPTQ